MGAKETKSKITNSYVYVKYNPTLVDYVDLKFTPPYKTLLRIEIMRCKFILLWNDLLRKTGTITLKNAKFYYILESILLNLGVLSKENLGAIKLSAEDPYIAFEPNLKVTPEMVKIIDSYRKLLIFARENEKQIFELDDEINLNVIDVEDLTRNPDDILSKHNVPPIKITKMKQNLVSLKHGQVVIAAIKAIIEDIRRSIPDFINKFYRGEEMRKIENMVVEARSKNIVSPAKLVYKYINQPKLISFDDHHDAIDDDIKSEREAREILAAYYRDEEEGRAVLYPSKTEPNYLNKTQISSKDETPMKNQYRSVTVPNKNGFLQREDPFDYTNRTYEPRSRTLAREIGLEANRTYIYSRPDIEREQEEIQRRLEQARVSDINREIGIPAEISKSAMIQRNDEFKREIAEIERRVSGDVRRANETVKVESLTKKKKKLRKLKPKKHKGENKENISENRPVEEAIYKSSKNEEAEKNTPTIDAYLPQKQAFKDSKIKENKPLSSSPEMRSGNGEFRAEEKLNQTNNTLDIYDLYLKDIYINPANTKTVIKSILKIPEENLIVTGSDTGEVRIFHFNKNVLQKKSEILEEEDETNFSPSLRLLHEIKVFDSPIKSMVFLPSREYSSYFSEKGLCGKNAENLKLKYYLVAACMDGHMSLIDLRNFNEEKVYPSEADKEYFTRIGQLIDKDAILPQPRDNIVIESIAEAKEDNNNTKDNNLNENKKIIKQEIINITDKISDVNLEKNEAKQKQKDLVKKLETTEVSVEQVIPSEGQEPSLNPLIFSSKINTVNLPIYSMVFVPNRKTVLFSQGTDIFEFNNFPPLPFQTGKTHNEKNIDDAETKPEEIQKLQKTVSKIRLLIPEAHNDEINSLYFIKDKNILVSCSKDNRILLWDFSDPDKAGEFSSIGELAGSTSRIYSLCSGYIEGVWHIASLSKEGIVNFWNLENKEKSKTITFPFKIKSIQFSGYENIFIIIIKANGFILFDAFEDQYKEYCNMDKINKDLIEIASVNADRALKNEGVQEEFRDIKSTETREEKGNYKLNIHPKKKIENLDFEKLNLLSLRLMSKYTCGILVGNYSTSIENENDVYYAIFANKLGNLDVWANFDETENA